MKLGQSFIGEYNGHFWTFIIIGFADDGCPQIKIVSR